jgi:hypothetical protein
VPWFLQAFPYLRHVLHVTDQVMSAFIASLSGIVVLRCPDGHLTGTAKWCLLFLTSPAAEGRPLRVQLFLKHSFRFLLALWRACLLSAQAGFSWVLQDGLNAQCEPQQQHVMQHPGNASMKALTMIVYQFTA